MLRIYWWLESRLAPGLRYSQYFFEEELECRLRQDDDWLDLGCGHGLLPSWRREKEASLVARSGNVVGIDYDFASLEKHGTIKNLVRGRIDRLPFRDRSFRMLSSNMVVEHLTDPISHFQEAKRVLQDGGLYVLHTPNARGYNTVIARVLPDWLKSALVRLLEGRSEEDLFPAYYRANTPERLSEIAKAAGFEVVRTRMLVSSAKLAVLPPLVIPELLLLRFLMTRSMRKWRTNILITFRRKETDLTEPKETQATPAT